MMSRGVVLFATWNYGVEMQKCDCLLQPPIHTRNG